MRKGDYPYNLQGMPRLNLIVHKYIPRIHNQPGIRIPARGGSHRSTTNKHMKSSLYRSTQKDPPPSILVISTIQSPPRSYPTTPANPGGDRDWPSPALEECVVNKRIGGVGSSPGWSNVTPTKEHAAIGRGRLNSITRGAT